MIDVARGINRAMRVHGFLALYYPSMNKNHRKSFSEYFSVENERVLERVKAGENVRKLPWKVGHGGTLDPEASGVLYSTAKLRKTTINSINLDWYYDSITEKLREQPSDKGQLAYQGTNRIEIGDPATKLLSTDEGKGYFQVSVKCSRGTYIRTLIDDMCKEIGSCGVTSDIIRTEEGPFKLGVNTIELSELENVEGVLAAVSECCKLLNYNGNPDGAITLSV
ncbi:tRNA pseudouridine synthase B [Zancudomyces culisetae]|uniref:tRNA pseudouridine synthase B n=1 Tax=Zancudomyces culisetae TaxID=1213189 RepID=A0A1R1PGZ1_ZANCU|nr:tRNA pseudouridine synthase B [Zancudomyces culisetae]|eukprot:OMH80244.1 tRNA pseudouridine synthase B [Zancudomyces culisetae]